MNTITHKSPQLHISHVKWKRDREREIYIRFYFETSKLGRTKSMPSWPLLITIISLVANTEQIKSRTN